MQDHQADAQYMKDLKESAPEMVSAFFCIEDHTKRAVTAGASKADIAEAVMVATALRAGGGVTHGWKAMRSIAEGH
ncbi:carboxymuconolactone decarboxylase family protein [Pseudarthrobacter sp. 1G09]|uniref:carboxymuconolactone decarboxylase family protein n=1 Tax=Pseudarthrobacter sp. 1G09 TaxID=3416178 RepID=UPI003CEE81D8